MIKYSMVKRGNPQKKRNPGKYYPVAQSTETEKLEDFCKRAGTTVYGNAQLLANIPIYADAIRDALLQGRIVDLGELGRFSITLKGAGAESPEKYNPKTQIKEVCFHWEPGWNKKKFLQDASFKKVVSRKQEKIQKKKDKEKPTL